MTTINVQVYLDTVCAWCYIGERAFEKAVELYRRTYPGGSEDNIKLTWLPYYLNPNAPDKGIPLLEQMTIKNGADKVNAIRTRVGRVGREHGIEFSFASKIGKTKDSHRLIYLAGTKTPELQTALVSEIFRVHFEGTADITSHEDLSQAAIAVGLPEQEVAAVLQSDKYGDEVDRLAVESREKGIASVPTYLIGARKIDGAESVGDFYEALIAAKTGSADA